MELTTRPGVLSLALGLPATDLFPASALARAAEHLLSTDPGCLQYTADLKPLKEQVVELMASRGVRVRPEQVFLTTGSQQAMDLLCRLFVDPGSQVLLEETIYDGIKLAVRQREVEILTVSTDAETGIDVDEVESHLRRGARPALLYVVTDGHNPLGVSLSPEKRQRLVEVARLYRLPILEDDAYGFLYYEREPHPPMRALDDKWIFYMGSFSKILAPALRAGWTIVPEELVPRLSMLKHGADVDTPSFSFHLISAYLATGEMPEHLAKVRAEYRRRRDAMLGALKEHLPRAVRWNRPSSGLFVWVELPRGLDATALLRTAVETEQVAFSPGDIFATGPRGHAGHCLRLSFANNTIVNIEDGIRRLGRAVRAMMSPV